MSKKNVIVLTDETGKDVEVELLFSIVNPDNNIRYLYIADPEDAESVIVLQSDEEGNIEQIGEDIEPDLEEFLQDTFQAFQNGDLVQVGEDGEMVETSSHEVNCSCGENGESSCSCCCGDADKEESCSCGCSCSSNK